ncbi:ribulose bisphosphate carboxylase small chain [Aliidongia dinghuensis]|uniref:Ribulose bisphosphate carboxylase small subunit n=1 Tax=Aliidongia dinghuensis TaxID=1867774 RepID=A0A8J3E193_9PROT|nr:ribulose bisphosphate carboxylase small subunit [Aliidongia dinghuensis]GGE98915.1 ribulose bisphosphate carboxylase small chain [Aliidongia dinghuensis]
MRLTQGQFSFLPDLTDDEIRLQIEYALGQGWAIGIEFTDDPHPRNTYWSMWGTPMFDIKDPAGIMMELKECRAAHGGKYIRLLAFDASKGFETLRMSFIVDRPAEEPGFELVRTEGAGRRVGYAVRSYATTRHPSGTRYARSSAS